MGNSESMWWILVESACRILGVSTAIGKTKCNLFHTECPIYNFFKDFYWINMLKDPVFDTQTKWIHDLQEHHKPSFCWFIEYLKAYSISQLSLSVLLWVSHMDSYSQHIKSTRGKKLSGCCLSGTKYGTLISKLKQLQILSIEACAWHHTST